MSQDAMTLTTKPGRPAGAARKIQATTGRRQTSSFRDGLTWDDCERRMDDFFKSRGIDGSTTCAGVGAPQFSY